MEQEPTYIGIDVAKAQVDVAVHPTGLRWQAPSTEEGVQELVSRVQALQPTLVLLEASGGLEIPRVAALVLTCRWWS